ncbi:hypothetical protein RiCNE_11460 [Rickettsia endosymbiont of Culicoides newsteadi]|nr:hypothetical protein RiCNE_11460 [Rickettsia endosymbiont of Culicoides newsteadi]
MGHSCANNVHYAVLAYKNKVQISFLLRINMSILLILRMAFKSHIENSLASLREATLVATKQSNKCGLPRPRSGLAMT